MRLSPSLYAADPLRLGEQVEALAPHVASFHVDVMDGAFAPAFGLGGRLVKELVARTPRPVDVHLMIEDPGRWVGAFARAGARSVAFHVEVAEDPETLVAEVRSHGALAYLALQPTTPLERAARLAEAIDGLLLLTAPAGGGAFDKAAMRRIADRPPGLPTIVDGGLEPRHFDLLRQASVDLAVVGRTLFDAPDVVGRARRLCRELDDPAGDADA